MYNEKKIEVGDNVCIACFPKGDEYCQAVPAEGRTVVLMVGPHRVLFLLHEFEDTHRLTHYRSGLRICDLTGDCEKEAQYRIDSLAGELGLEKVVSTMKAAKTLNSQGGHDL